MWHVKACEEACVDCAVFIMRWKLIIFFYECGNTKDVHVAELALWMLIVMEISVFIAAIERFQLIHKM